MPPSQNITISDDGKCDAYKLTLISSSCISRYSNFLFVSETGSPDGKAATPTVSTTSSGKEESVAWTASSGFTFPEIENALQREWDDYAFPEGKSLKSIVFQHKILRYLERIKREDGREWLRDRSSQSLSCNEM